MHFTVVNVNTRTQTKSRSFCRKHQLTILVVSMSVIFTLGILAAVWCLECKYIIAPFYISTINNYFVLVRARRQSSH